MGSDNNRQLAAVMFTDIVGYSAMMQENETKANQHRERHCRVLREKARALGGRVMNFYGDGAITVFSSAFKAVLCAIQIQRDLKKSSLPLRIGLHMGDIVCSNEEVYGDAVNVASRLEGLSTVGSILISEKIRDEINNNTKIKTVSLGSFQLKNIKQPVNVFAVCNSGIKVPVANELTSESSSAKRITVLPFLTMTNEKGFEYFSDGLTEEIIHGLTKVEELEVTSRTSAFAYKGCNVDVRSIGKKHSVSHVLEGSVRKYKDKIRITAQLIETERGFHVWSETYEQHLKDIFVVQDIVCNEILQKVGKSLNTKPEKAYATEKLVKSLNLKGRLKVFKNFFSGFFQPSVIPR